MSLAIAALIAWGALAFGAVYPWAYIPLAAGAAVVGTGVLVANRRRIAVGPASIAALVLIAAVLLQVVPLDVGTLKRLSHGADRILSATDVSYAVGAPSHALSIDVTATMFGAAAIALLALWVAATAFTFSRPGALEQFVRALIVVGTGLAIIGLAQQATFNGKLLWFWTPQYYATNAFGPFVNRNHFAGWMLLAFAVCAGHLFGKMHVMKGARTSEWRDRILWLGSSEATPVILMSATVAIMACSIVWTLSRSGIAAAGAALAMLVVTAMWRSPRAATKRALAAYVVVMIVGVAAWRGGDRLVNWYGDTRTLAWRVQLWKDTAPALEDFWLTGAGLNTYSTVMLVYPRTDQGVDPREAHNDYLELAVDGGMLVGIPSVILILALGRAVFKRLRQPQDEATWWIRMGAVAAIGGLAVQELTDFSLQIPGVALLFATCLGIALHDPAPAELHQRAARSRRPRAVQSG